MGIVGLVLSFFLFDNLRAKRSVPLTEYSGIECFISSCSTLVNHCHNGCTPGFELPAVQSERRDTVYYVANTGAINTS